MNLSLSRESYERLEEIALWEGRLPAVVADMLMHLGFAVYGELLERLAGKPVVPEGVRQIASSEILIEAVGRGALVHEAASLVEQRSREIVEELRRERGSTNA